MPEPAPMLESEQMSKPMPEQMQIPEPMQEPEPMPQPMLMP